MIKFSKLFIYLYKLYIFWGLLWWLRWYIICLQRGRPGFDPWVGKSSSRKEWQPTPVFLPGEFHGQRSLVSYSPYIYIYIYIHIYIYIYTHTHTYTYIHIHTYIAVVVVLSLSCVQLFATPRTVACHLPLSSSIFRSLLKLMSIESVMLSNHLSLCCPLLLPSIFPSIRVFPMSQLFTSGG